jgi:hypothetical protein
LEDGRSVSLRDDWSDKGGGKAYRTRAYSYIEFVPQLRQHLVHVQYYEGGCFYLVDAKSGNKTEICGVPIVSAKARRFACYVADLETGSSVEVWRIRATEFQREWVFEPTDWVPAGLVWLSDDSIRISKEDFEGREVDHAVVTRRGSAWVWDK